MTDGWPMCIALLDPRCIRIGRRIASVNLTYLYILPKTIRLTAVDAEHVRTWQVFECMAKMLQKRINNQNVSTWGGPRLFNCFIISVIFRNYLTLDGIITDLIKLNFVDKLNPGCNAVRLRSMRRVLEPVQIMDSNVAEWTIPWHWMESQTFEPQPFQEEFKENYDFQSQDLIAFGKEMGFNLTELLNRKSRPPPGLFQTTLKLLDLYATPCIIIVGIIGNTLSLLVFSLTYLRRLSSSLYLSTLSVADIGFLLALSIVWLDRVNCFLFRRDIWCQAVVFTTKVCGFLAAWNVVTFTMERYITVYHPLRKDTLCTKQTGWNIIRYRYMHEW